MDGLVDIFRQFGVDTASPTVLIREMLAEVAGTFQLHVGVAVWINVLEENNNWTLS